MYNPMDLTGKRILVTGASAGIGRACAVVLDELGAELILVARNESQLEETRLLAKNGSNHAIIPFDLSHVDKIADVMTRYDFKQNKINGVVHSAGVTGAIPLNGTTTKVCADLFNINFFSYIELCRLLTKRFYCAEAASFVAISSAASMSAWKGGVAYCASKAALDASTRVLALEFAERRIRFNTVIPSYIRTKMVEDTMESGVDLERILQNRQPLGLGEPRDVAHAVAFLLSDSARFITGTGLVVDGGWLAQ